MSKSNPKKRARARRRQTSPEEKGKWALSMGAGMLCLIGALAVYIYLSALEAQGGQGRIHWLVALAYSVGGKLGAVLVLAIPGTIFFLVGLVQMFKTAIEPWTCPDCGGDIPRKATTRQQFWWGGGTCPECGCEVDMKGQKAGPPKRKKARAQIDDDDERDDFEEERPSRSASGRRRQRDDDSDDEPVRRRRTKPAQSRAVLWWSLGVGGAVLLLGCVGLGVLLNLDDPVNNGGAGFQKEKRRIEELAPPEARTEVAGGGGDSYFKDEAPQGGLLIGVEVVLGKFLDIDIIHGIQPIYRTAQGEVRGQAYGAPLTRPILIKANPGYAIGGLDTKAGLLLNGFAAKFMRVKGAGLDPTDTYVSPWVGDATGGSQRVLGGDGTPIIGIIVNQNATETTGLALLKRI